MITEDFKKRGAKLDIYKRGLIWIKIYFLKQKFSITNL